MSEEKKFAPWLKSHLWLIGGLIGVLAFLSWAGPILTSKPIEATFADPYWTFAHGSRANVGIGSILFGVNGSPINGFFLAFYILTLGGVVFSFLGIKKDFFYEIALFCYLVAGISFISSPVFYDFALCNATVGTSELMNYLEDWGSEASTKLTFGATFSCVMNFLGAITIFSADFEKKRFTVRDMAEIAIFSAVAVILDLVQHLLPSIGVTGGSIGIAMLPLFFVALRLGPLAGFLSGGLVYGLITCLTDGYGIVFYPFDYLVGFGSVAICGFFKPLVFGKNQKTYNLKGEIFILVGVIGSAVVRFLGSSISSIVNYGYNIVAAFAYNYIYVFASAGICAVILMALYGPLAKLNAAFPSRSVDAH